MENKLDFSSLQDKSGMFEIKMDSNCFRQDDTFISTTCEAKVISAPKKFDNWQMKILRFLTFGMFFRPFWVYDICIVELDNRNKNSNK
jgi:hypothetical protein